MTPFIQLNAIKSIFRKNKTKFKLITRYNLNDFYDGVSSLDAIEYVLKKGGQVKGIKYLHSKLYIFDSKEAILSSANLTQSALLKNFEFGVHICDTDAIFSVEAYFDKLWDKIPDMLSLNQIYKWKQDIDTALKDGKASYKKTGLKDHGFVIDNKPRNKLKRTSSNILDSNQYFIKFFGEGHNRVDINMDVLEEIERSGCHWACTYPHNKRPRSVRDGAIIFIGRLVSDPNDIMIFGYAVGSAYKENRDDATTNDIKLRSWKKHWSRYIRVHNAKFIDGKLKHGISMNELMSKFNHNSFASTQRNKTSGKGNIKPKNAYSQQAAVQLTQDSASWLLEKLESKLGYHGTISNSILSEIE